MKIRFIKSLVVNRELWLRLTEREILGRYRGSALGILWSFITPLVVSFPMTGNNLIPSKRLLSMPSPTGWPRRLLRRERCTGWATLI